MHQNWPLKPLKGYYLIKGNKERRVGIRNFDSKFEVRNSKLDGRDWRYDVQLMYEYSRVTFASQATYGKLEFNLKKKYM